MENYDFDLIDPHQTAFVNSNSRYLLNSGGVGSGKTYSLVLRAIKMLVENPGIFGVIGAQTMPLLRNTTLREFLAVCPPEIISNHNKSTNTFDFTMGSTLVFLPLDDPNKLKSINAGFIAIEEMTDIDEEIFKMLRTRLRQIGMPHCLFGATNPSVFENFVYRYFIDKPIRNSEVVYSESADNFHLPPEYLEDLEEMRATNPEYYERMVKGKWGKLEGLIYNLPMDLRIRADLMPENFPRVVGGLDFGYAHPMALLTAGETDGRFDLIDELYRRKMSGDDTIKIVKEYHEKHNYDVIYADSSRPEIIEDLQREGLPVMPAIKDVFAGIMYVKGLIGGGNLRISKNCTYTLREFDSYIWDKKNVVKEVPLKINDDAMDALRYLCYSDYKGGRVGKWGARKKPVDEMLTRSKKTRDTVARIRDRIRRKTQCAFPYRLAA